MDPSNYGDVEHLVVQLNGSDKSPRAPKTILRQTFTTRRYNVERDGRLTSLAKAIEQPVDDAPRDSALCNAADKTTESIITLLRPHTGASSKQLGITARAITGLTVGNFGVGELHGLLNIYLDVLAVSPQAKRGIIPALMGFTKVIEVRSRGAPMCQPQVQLASASSCFDGEVSVDSNTHPRTVDSLVPYETRERRFTSNTGSGKTTWYFAKSSTNISSPPAVPQAEIGHVYVHFDSSTRTHQYWMFGTNNEWQSVSKGSEYPMNHDRVLSIRNNGEPSWVTRASIATTQGRKERGRSVHG